MCLGGLSVVGLCSDSAVQSWGSRQTPGCVTGNHCPLPFCSPKTVALPLGYKIGVATSPTPAHQDRVCCSWVKETPVVNREANQLSRNVSQSLEFPLLLPIPLSAAKEGKCGDPLRSEALRLPSPVRALQVALPSSGVNLEMELILSCSVP